MIRKVFLTLLMALPLVGAMAQTDFAKEWDDVNKLYDSKDYNKAYSKATKLFAEAQRLGDSRNTLTGAFKMGFIASEYQENVSDSILARYLDIVDKLDAVDKALCHAIIARIYYSYYKWNNYTITHKNEDTDEDDLDYKLWPEKRFEQEIAKHNALALEAKEILQKTDIKSVEVFCEKPVHDGFNTTPTLYDLVMNMAIESEKNPTERLRMADELIAFHRNDDECLRIWLDLKKLELEEGVANSESPTSETYIQHAEMYNGGCDLVTQFYLKAANKLYSAQRFVEAKACCDKAVAMYPESSGGVECANMINRIVHPECSILIDNDEQMADHAILAITTHRNVDAVYYRVVKDFESQFSRWNENYIKELLEQPAVKQWSQSVERNADYKEQRTYTYIPSLPTGEYILIASTSQDFKENGLSYGSFTCCDAMLLPALPEGNALRGYLILRRSGEPVVGQKISLVLDKLRKGNKEKTIATTVTDKNGYYEFKDDYVGVTYDDILSVQTTYNGLLLEEEADEFQKEVPEKKVQLYCQLDRPVYKLGETVSFAYVAYSGDGHTTGRVCPGMRLDVSLHDVNGKTVDSARFSTDEFGMCHGEFKIPADALPGPFHLEAKHGKRGRDYSYVKVEEYKQPKFTVKMYGDKQRHSFGKELTVNGLAVSYSQVPINGAKVSYTVVRSEMYRPWRWWYRPVAKQTTIAGGVTSTDADGKFEIRFTPQPDSSVSLANKPCFAYLVTADVTDLNGETHSQTLSLRVGFENSYISLPQEVEVDSFDSIRFSYCNLDGDPIDGNVSVQIYSLRQPQPRIEPDLFKLIKQELGDAKVSHSISRDEFSKLFGDLAYDKSDIDPSLWPEERLVLDKKVHASKDLLLNSVSLGRLPAGTYRVKCRTVDSDGQSVESHNTYIFMPPDSKKVQSHSLIWTSGGKSALVGDTYSLRIGSCFKGVKVIYLLSKDSEVLDRRTIELNDNVKTIDIPIKDSYKGGVRVELFAIRENVVCSKSFGIYVPYPDKNLDITISSFRDKLQPGATETWTIKVTPQPPAEHIQTSQYPNIQTSNLILTMYDAALDAYGQLEASFNPWLPSYNPHMLVPYNSRAWFGSFDWSDHQRQPRWNHVPPLFYNGWTLEGFMNPSRILYSTESYACGIARGEGGMVTMQGGVRKRTAKNAALQLDEIVTVGTAESGARISSDDIVVASVGGVADDSQSSASSSIPDIEQTSQLRSNLNTLAFFYPSLRTGDDGTVECSFTVPELLTQWSIRGVAHTKDLMTGSISKSLITQKELMVQPNAPRFLRHGDTVDFLAKVINMTDKAQTVTVSFDLTDASSDSQQNISTQSQSITIPAKRSEQVSFRIAVPHNIYVVNYRIVAKNDHFSDGEQDCLPVLSDRQLVTVSQAMFINGVGEKSYSLPEAATRQSASCEPHLLKVEFTSNPIWYAIQALPYVEDHTNPSNIFLANRLYTNSIAFGIVNDNPSIESLFRQWEKDTVNPLVSQLEKNEDVKQTLLDETPWLRDGTGESQRMHRIAAYFKKSRLSSELKSTEKKLFDQQRSDGGWSWIPGYSHSNLYTTQYILQTLGKLALATQPLTQSHNNAIKQLKKALQYVDNETYEYYRRHLKHTDFEALNIDYLYMRSFYTDSEFKLQDPKYKESYDYFYRNTLKHYKEYKSLHTRATLALVFHRGGNSKEALDILRRIKQSALYSDEMGMYWRDNQSSWWWYERPIETQALLIQAFAEITPDDKEAIGKMQQWLLKQKQATSWNTDVATVEAINALLSDKGTANTLTQPEKSAMITVAGQPMNAPVQTGTGYQSQSWHGEEIAQLLSEQSNPAQVTGHRSQVTIKKYTEGIAWGAAYYQYFDDMKNIAPADMGVKMSKTIYRVKTDGSLEAIQQSALSSQLSDHRSQVTGHNSQLKVGDRVRIRILLDCDRALEYVELKDSRPGCLEPVSTASGWNWNSGLSYYSAVRNASNSFFINRLDKGKYVVEYDLFVTNPGVFTVPASTIQCLYAPEFRANSEGRTLYVK